MSEISVPILIQKSKEYYSMEGNKVGGNLHIILDDGNINDSSINFCLNQATIKGDKLGIELCKLLLLASKTQRNKLVNSYNLYG
jgi:hypothetical protein